MRQYLCIDLKSFYASVECVERGLDPMQARLVVADPERCHTTICLAVSPEMKRLGVKNRCRVFEIPPHIDYIMATPRMQLYIDYSCRIYRVYLEFIAPEDIHVYSVDEAFLDVTCYLALYRMTPRELAERIRRRILEVTGIPATCGIGTNLYLAKIALDITAKKSPDFMGELDEERYCRTLWDHLPLTDFWRIGPGTARRLARVGAYTMGQVALLPEKTLYKLFGIDAEILIDHAWGREPVTMADIKRYKSKSRSLSTGQVLARGYSWEEGLIIAKEMADQLCLSLAEQHLTTTSLNLRICYEKDRDLPVHGSSRLHLATCANTMIVPRIADIYRAIVNPELEVRRLMIAFCDVEPDAAVQLSMLADDAASLRDRDLMHAVNDLKHRFGRNAVLKGMDFQQGATTIARNGQIGGHRRGEPG